MITSAEEFVRLRTSDAPEDYGRAGNEEAPMAVWVAIVENYPAMREWVASNKTVPLEILAALAQDQDERVRRAVAAKRKLSTQLFELLACDPSEMVRLGVIGNKKAPAHVLASLAEDADEFVRSRARATIDSGRP